MLNIYSLIFKCIIFILTIFYILIIQLKRQQPTKFISI